MSSVLPYILSMETRTRRGGMCIYVALVEFFSPLSLVSDMLCALNYILLLQVTEAAPLFCLGVFTVITYFDSDFRDFVENKVAHAAFCFLLSS